MLLPLAALLQVHLGGWRPTIWALTGLAVLIMLLSIGLNDSREIAAANRAGGDRQSAGSAVVAMSNSRGVAFAPKKGGRVRVTRRVRVPAEVREAELTA